MIKTICTCPSCGHQFKQPALEGDAVSDFKESITESLRTIDECATEIDAARLQLIESIDVMAKDRGITDE